MAVSCGEWRDVTPGRWKRVWLGGGGFGGPAPRAAAGVAAVAGAGAGGAGIGGVGADGPGEAAGAAAGCCRASPAQRRLLVGRRRRRLAACRTPPAAAGSLSLSSAGFSCGPSAGLSLPLAGFASAGAAVAGVAGLADPPSGLASSPPLAFCRRALPPASTAAPWRPRRRWRLPRWRARPRAWAWQAPAVRAWRGRPGTGGGVGTCGGVEAGCCGCATTRPGTSGVPCSARSGARPAHSRSRLTSRACEK